LASQAAIVFAIALPDGAGGSKFAACDLRARPPVPQHPGERGDVVLLERLPGGLLDLPVVERERLRSRMLFQGCADLGGAVDLGSSGAGAGVDTMLPASPTEAGRGHWTVYGSTASGYASIHASTAASSSAG
jgi:hypothetical protein